jgi:type II secretory pathway pseudopilin PulG
MKGFTLIETIVAIFVFTLITGVISTFIIMAYRVHGYSWQQIMAINEARKGIEIMVKEIRMARPGEDGSYSIEKAEDKEFIFYSDIDSDGKIERIRYFLGTVNSGSQVKECETFSEGGSCTVNFSDFLKGGLISAEVKISVKGDFGHSQEYAEIYASGLKLGDICRGSSSNCSDCSSFWQGTNVFNVTDQVVNGSINFLADASSRVGAVCPYAMKVYFEFSWMEDLTEMAHQFKKGVIKPIVGPSGQISYPLDQEQVTVLTSYVCNMPPIFKYFDQQGEEIIETPARLIDTKVMEVYLIVNVNPERAPQDFELRSAVQLRNLKEE